MYRYIAFTWDANDRKKKVAVQQFARKLLSKSGDWQRVMDRPGLCVLDTPSAVGARHAYVLPRNAGVILGKVFKKNLESASAPPDPVFENSELRLLIESKGRHLVESYWGHYVAILQAVDGERYHVLRDPTGALHCYMTSFAGIGIIFSDIEDCVCLDLPPFSIDWGHLTAFFQHSRLVTRTTGFKEVTMLHAGECVATSGDVVTDRSFHWDPTDVCTSNTIEDPDEARTALKAVVEHCVGAWGSSYDSIVHELSGGLDSSIVASCLASSNAPPALLCFHYYTETTEGDERPYARAVAKDIGCELVERQIRASEKPLKELLGSTKYATPAMLGFESPQDLTVQRLVAEHRAGAIFSGHGGDQLFHEARTMYIAAEYARRHGVRPRLLRIVRDTSKLTYRSVWSVLRCTVNDGLLRRPYDPYMEYVRVRPILSEATRASLDPEPYRHPWLKTAAMLPTSKVFQILSVIDCQPFYQMPCSYAEQVHPLISQPIIELCLQIPTYVLTHGGVTRKLVRDAFESDVPAKVLQRQVKGDTTGHHNRLLTENAAFLREFLLDGVLVREGVLDRRVLERTLSDRELIRGKDISTIICSVAVENWLSVWASAYQRTAA